MDCMQWSDCILCLLNTGGYESTGVWTKERRNQENDLRHWQRWIRYMHGKLLTVMSTFTCKLQWNSLQWAFLSLSFCFFKFFFHECCNYMYIVSKQNNVRSDYSDYSPKWRCVSISTTFTDTEVNNCFSILYHTSWITSRPKSNFTCDNIPTKAILFYFSCSEVRSTWLITSKLASQRYSLSVIILLMKWRWDLRFILLIRENLNV